MKVPPEAVDFGRGPNGTKISCRKARRNWKPEQASTARFPFDSYSKSAKRSSKCASAAFRTSW